MYNDWAQRDEERVPIQLGVDRLSDRVCGLVLRGRPHR